MCIIMSMIQGWVHIVSNMIDRFRFTNDWLNHQFFSVKWVYMMRRILRPRMQVLLPMWICARFLCIVLFETMVE